MSNNQYISLKNQLDVLLTVKPINDISDLFYLIKASMEYVEKIKSPEMKKDLVVYAISNVIHKKDMNDSTKTLLLNLIEPCLYIAIDISKKRWNINKFRSFNCYH